MEYRVYFVVTENGFYESGIGDVAMDEVEIRERGEYGCVVE